MYFPSIPISYSIEITFECNNYCPGCANVLKSNRHEVLYEWKRVFDNIAPPHNRHRYAELIRITGGEPTLHEEFSQIIKYVDTFGVPHATFTNGSWKNPAEIIETFQNCHHFIGLLISLHGCTTSAHRAFTGGSEITFDEICSNIQRAANAGIVVFTNTVLTKYNYHQIEEIIHLSQNLGATHAVFNRYLGKPHSIEPTNAQLSNAIRLIEHLQYEGVPCRIGDCIPPCFEKNSSLGSNGGIEHCVISPQGFVRPDNLTSYTFGNIFEQSIEDIWQSEKAQWYRNQIPEQCLECAEIARCRGGCRSLMVEYRLEGDPLMKEPIQEGVPEVLEFDPEWKPVPHFAVREESFGYLLTRMNWSIQIALDAKPVIEVIDGKHTLTQIQEQFGDAALNFIGQLYREEFVEFELK